MSLSSPWRKCILRILGVVVLIICLALSTWFLLRALYPHVLPQSVYYDFIANYHITERLLDPALLKLERWDILGEERNVLFVHPSSAGSAALVYPVRLEPGTTLQADLAIAPEAWALKGDGVTFSVYVEDDAGMHLVYGRYVDPKHHQQDRRWVPIRVNLAPYHSKLVRLILAVSTGPAGDGSFDWAGWGQPRLERPVWP